MPYLVRTYAFLKLVIFVLLEFTTFLGEVKFMFHWYILLF